MSEFRELVRRFLEEGDFSKAAARRLEDVLVGMEVSPSDELQDLLDLLASYSPGGGDLLYDRAQLEKFMQSLSTK